MGSRSGPIFAGKSLKLFRPSFFPYALTMKPPDTSQTLNKMWYPCDEPARELELKKNEKVAFKTQ